MISNDRDLVELLPDIIYEADLNLNLTYVNSVAFEKFGYSQEDLNMGLNIVQLIDPEYKERAISKVKLIFGGKKTDPGEYLLRKKDGSSFFARVHSRPIYKNGHIVGLRGTINDINEMILAEQELKESEDKFRTIAEQSFMGIIIIQDGLFKYFNEQARKLNEYSLEEIQNWEPNEFIKLIHPDDKEFVIEQARKKQMGEKDVIQQHKYRIITKTGEVRWIENFSKTINYKGKPADLVMSVDITDKINAEQRLKDSEEKYRLITENSQDIVYTLDINLNNTYVSPSVYYVLGYDVDEAILMHPRDNSNKDDLEKIGRIYKEEFKLERKKNIGKDLNRKRVFTVREKHKDGRILSMEHTISWLRDENGIAVGFLGVARDVTEKKHTEKLLRESEERYRLISENANDLITVLDMKLNYEYINKGYELLGYSKEEIYNSSAPDLVHPDDVKRALKAFRKGKEIGSNSEELRVKHKDGHYSWFEVKGKIFKDKNDDPKALLISRDITERKEIERQLKESEEKYRLISENTDDLIVVYDEKLRVEYSNEATHSRILGYSPLRLKKLAFRTSLIHRDDINQTGRVFQEVFRTGKFKQQLRIKHKDGNYLWFETRGRTFIDEEGKSKLLAVSRDITERKEAEQKLKESEEKYRKLFDNSPIALMDQDYSEMKRHVDNLKASGINDFEKYFDDNPEEILKFMTKVKVIDVNRKALEIYKASSKEDFIFIMNHLGEIEESKITKEVFLDNKMVILSLIKGNKAYESEIATKTLTGDNIFIYVKTSIVPGFESTWSKIIVSIADITDRKFTEQKLKESEEKFRKILEANPDTFYLLSGDSTVLEYKNYDKKTEIFFKPEYLGKKVQEFLPVDMAKIVAENISKTIDTQQPQTTEFTAYIDNDFFTAEGRFLYLSQDRVGLFLRTITEKKKLEIKLQKSEEKYRHLYENSPYAILLINTRGDVLDCNFRSEELSGFKKNELIGMNFPKSSFIPKEFLPLVLDDFKALIKGRPIESREIQLYRKDTTLAWVSYQASTFQIEDEMIFQIIIQDITERKKADQKVIESEEKYRDLLETSSIGVLEYDIINKEMTYINPKLLNIIGYKREELNVDIFMNKLVHEKDLAKLLRTNEESELEFRILDKQGKLKWLSGKRIPHFDENGEIVSIRIWLDDITEKKIYEELIYELNINFLNFTTDIRNNIELLLNTGLKLINGDLIIYAHKSESAGQEGYQILTSDNESYFYSSKEFHKNLFISELFTEGHDFPQKFYNINNMKYIGSDPFIKKSNFKSCFGKAIKSQDGLDNIVCVFYKNNPNISGQDKLVLFLICDAIEIEQRRWQVQQDLEKQNITLNEINKLKTELFSRTSHELKTPLISIKGFTELLLTLHKAKLDPETISILEEIKDGGKRLEKIINLLLESTKLEAGQLKLNIANEDLTFLINFCVKELKGLAKLRNQSILFDPNKKVEAKFDKERIYEAISNLLLNAVKYTPPGGTISIETYLDDDSYIISVKDNGIGFTEEEKSQVFKQFGKIERYGQGWDVAIEGTGLGLYITKKLVELHGGKIWLESEGRDKGSTFSFSIPKL